MILEKNLTKENFFNEMMGKFPNAMKHFCDWIDEYKAAVGWGKLFNNHYCKGDVRKAANGEISHIDYSAPKYHDLPYAMQYGIWIEYCRQSLSDFFEQPEHISDSIDLREDMEGVFKELNEIIVPE